MSKSDPSDYSRINLSDDADTIAQKVRKAKTDPEALPSAIEGLKQRPEAENLIGIFAALNGETKEDVLKFSAAVISRLSNRRLSILRWQNSARSAPR